MNLSSDRTLPRGTLVRSRVVDDPAVALEAALDRELTGYAVFEPGDALLLDDEGSGVLTFAAGVPVLAYHTGTDRGGPAALSDLTVPGPYSVDLYESSADVLDDVHDTPELQVPPGMPADRLGGDTDLAVRTRDAAPAERLDATPVTDDEGTSSGAVEAFLEDDERIAAIREEAREQAERRAKEWGLSDQLE